MRKTNVFLLARALRSWFLLLVAFAAVPASVYAQGLSGITPGIEEALRNAQRGTVKTSFVGETVPLEGAVDPRSYIVGPGDVFNVSINTPIPTTLSVAVSADGQLVIPSVGGFEVAGASLADARIRVLEGVRRSFRFVDAEVALERPRQFYVHVAGTVLEPGRHVVAPVARVEDAITEAMGGSSPIVVLREMKRAAAYTDAEARLPALRSVEVRRKDGTRETVDLWRYYTSGDLAHNPYVRDGDAVYVPSFSETRGSVTVEGDMPNAGTYDYRDGDTALALLTVATGTAGVETLGEVRLVRRGSPDGVTLDATALATGQIADPNLHAGDRLIVKPSAFGAGTASAVGLVVYPGTYPIEAGATTLRELVDMAGGVRPNALLRGAYLERRGSPRAGQEPDQPTPFRDITLDPEVNPQAIELAFENEISTLSTNSDLGFAGRQFYGRAMLQPQRVSIDVAQALSASAPPIRLQDGDRLVVPRDPEGVLVIGQVGRPGYVPYTPGQSVDAYIAQAGGRSEASADVYVREAGTGRVTRAKGITPETGDYIFVDRVSVGDTVADQGLILQERNLERQRRLPYFQLALTTVSTAATLITIILTK